MYTHTHTRTHRHVHTHRHADPQVSLQGAGVGTPPPAQGSTVRPSLPSLRPPAWPAQIPCDEGVSLSLLETLDPGSQNTAQRDTAAPWTCSRNRLGAPLGLNKSSSPSPKGSSAFPHSDKTQAWALPSWSLGHVAGILGSQ